MSVPKISKIHARVQARGNPQLMRQTNQFWDEAQNFYTMCKQAIVKVEGNLAEQLATVVDNPELFAKVSDPKALVENVELLNRDLVEHNARLDAIYAKHADKVGGVSTLEEANAVTTINGEYASAMEVYDANIAPIVSSVLDQIGGTANFVAAIAEDKEFQQLQDVNVVTDIEVKNV